MCRRDTDNANVKESCSIAPSRRSRRLNGMVNRLLTFARPVRSTWSQLI